jgi:hypothetical protein
MILVGCKKDLRYDPKTIEELRKTSQKPVSPEEVSRICGPPDSPIPWQAQARCRITPFAHLPRSVRFVYRQAFSDLSFLDFRVRRYARRLARTSIWSAQPRPTRASGRCLSTRRGLLSCLAAGRPRAKSAKSSKSHPAPLSCSRHPGLGHPPPRISSIVALGRTVVLRLLTSTIPPYAWSGCASARGATNKSAVTREQPPGREQLGTSCKSIFDLACADPTDLCRSQARFSPNSKAPR